MPLFNPFFRGRRSRADLAGLDPGDARSLALLDAMGGIERAGYDRSASPAGAIAKNLIPLFGAIIQGKLMEQQAAQQQEMLGLEKLKLQAETAKALKGDEPKNFTQAILDARKSGDQRGVDELMGLWKQSQKPPEETPAKLEIAGAREVLRRDLGRDPTPGEVTAFMQRQNFTEKVRLAGAEAVARAQAEQNATLNMLKQLGVGGVGTPPTGASGPSAVLPGGGMGAYAPPKIGISGGKLNVEFPSPKISAETQTIVARTQGLAGMRSRVEDVARTTPEIPNIGIEVSRYLMPSVLAEHPGLKTSAEMALMGPPNPEYSKYFQTIGEFNYAMTALATRLASRTGSAKMAQILSPHIPQLALQPEENVKKIEQLFGPQSVLVQEFLPEGRRAVKSGDLDRGEFADILKNFDVIQGVSQGPDGRMYGVSGKKLIPLE